MGDNDFKGTAVNVLALLRRVYEDKPVPASLTWIKRDIDTLRALLTAGDELNFVTTAIDTLDRLHSSRVQSNTAGDIAECLHRLASLDQAAPVEQFIEVVLSPDLTEAQKVGFLEVLGDLFEEAGGKGGLKIVGRQEVRDHAHAEVS